MDDGWVGWNFHGHVALLRVTNFKSLSPKYNFGLNNTIKKKKKLPVLLGPLSAIQPFSHTLIFNLPWSLGYMYITKLAFWSPWENYFTPVFLCSQHTVPRIILTCTPVHTLVEWRNHWTNVPRTVTNAPHTN